MKNLFAFLMVFNVMSYAFCARIPEDKPRLMTEFYNNLKENNFNRCGEIMIEYKTLPYQDGRFVLDCNPYNFERSEELSKMCHDLWEKWLDSESDDMNDRVFQQMTREYSWCNLDMLKRTLNDKRLTANREELMIFNADMRMRAYPGNEIYKLMTEHLFNYTIAKDYEPIAEKFIFALKFCKNDVQKIPFNREILERDNEIGSMLFKDGLRVFDFARCSYLIDIAQEFLTNCTNPSVLLAITKRLDTIDENVNYTMKYKEKITQDLNTCIDCYLYLNSTHELLELLNVCGNEMDKEHFKEALYFLNSKRDTQNVDPQIRNLMLKYQEKFEIDDEWRHMKKKIEALLEIVKDKEI